MKKHLLFGDVHGEYRDQSVLNIIHDFSQDWQPDRVWAMGDIGNFDWASKYEDDSEFKAEDEFSWMDELLEWLGVTDFCEGNHEDRLHRESIDPRIRGLYSLKRNLYTAKDIRIYPYTVDEVVKIGKMGVTHGFSYNKHVACTASEDFGRVAQWHAHRFQMYYHWKSGMKQAGYAIGCCCMLVMPFEKSRRPRGHTAGFCLMYEHDDGLVDVRPIPIIGDKVVIEGRVYERRL